MKRSVAALSVLPVFFAALAAPVWAQNDAGTPGGSNNSPQNAPIPSVIHLTPPKNGSGRVTTSTLTYRPGQTVRIAFTISNPTNKPVGYDYPTSQVFDVTVSSAQGNTVWDWAAGRKFAATITHLTLKPKQSRTYRVAWNERDTHGKPVPPGTYTINARTTSNNRPAITGNLVVNTETDPENMGFPTRTPADNGVVRNSYVTPPITASTPITIAAPPSKRR